MDTGFSNGNGQGGTHGAHQDVVGRVGDGVLHASKLPASDQHRPSSPSDLWPAAIDLAMQIGQAEARLPAVPTPDWLDRAAEMIAPIAAPGFGIVGLVTDNRGRVPMFDSVGVGSSVTQSAFGSGKLHARPLASRSVPGDLRQDIAAARIVELRAPTGDANWVGKLSDLMVADWTATSFGRAFLDNGLGHVIAGLAHLGGPRTTGQDASGHDSGRRLLVLAASAYEGNEQIIHALLSSALRTISERATIALGACGPTRWLTDREHEVLEQLTAGMSVREIAEGMNRSPHTVHDHVKALHRKLHATSRGELVALALGRPSTHADDTTEAIQPAGIAQSAEPKMTSPFEHVSR